MKGLNDACGGIYVVRKDGSVSEIHQLAVGGSENSEGNLPVSLVVGPDGFLYGTTVYGGTGGPSGCDGVGCGVFFRVGLDGAVGPNASFTVLHSFSYAERTQGGTITLGSDGNFYGSGGQNDFGANTIWKITPTGVVTVLYDFSYNATPPNPYTNGNFPSDVVEGSDGNFYGTTLANSDSGYAGTVFQMTPAGSLKNIAVLPGDGTLGVNPSGALVEGPDGAFYGTTRGASYNSLATPLATVFRVTADGKFTTLHTFSTVADGIYPVSSPLIVAADGNIYGTTQDGGDPTHCTYYDGCGVMFGITPGGTFTPLVTFAGGAKGAFPNTLIADAVGNITGTTGSDGTAGSTDTIFSSTPLSLTTGKPPITVAFYDQASGKATNQVNPGTPLIVKWNVLNAFSNTMQQCAAFRQDATDKTWTGLQAGTVSKTGFAGQVAIVAPMQTGNYVYALTCGGVESGFGFLTVGNDLAITTTILLKGTVGTAYGATLAATGGVYPYTWAILGGNVPKGFAIDPNTGLFGGTPKQFGSYDILFGVKDYSTVPLSDSTTLTFVVDSGLSMITTVPNTFIGNQYSQFLTTTGGLPPYTYKLVSGALPQGLTFNASAGLIFGTPTQAGTSTFAVIVSDSEHPAATLTQTYTMTTKARLRLTTSSPLPTMTVNVPYSFTMTAVDGVPPYKWSYGMLRGNLPVGLTLSPSGVLSGTPLQYDDKDYLLTIVTDSDNPPTEQNVDLSYKVISGLTLTSPGYPTGRVGVAFATPAPKARGGIPPYSFSAASNPPPIGSGLIIDASTGVISGIPLLSNVYALTLTVYDSEGQAAQTSITNFLTILPAALTSTTALSSSNTVAGTGMPVTLTATVSASGAVPTGTVIFYNGTSMLGTATLNAAGVATFTTTFATTGFFKVTAAYGGDTATSPSTSTAVTETVVTPAVSATVNPVTLTLQAGTSGTLVLTVTPVGGYTGTVTFSCGTLPAHVSCTFAPASLTIPGGGAAVTDTLTINTGAAMSAANRVPRFGGNSRRGVTMALGLWLPGPLLLFGAWTRRRRWVKLSNTLGAVALLAMGAAGLGMLNGCGGASNKATPGSYMVGITVTAGAAVQSVNATVVVQ